MRQDKHQYHSHSPEEWEEIDREKEKKKEPSRMPKRGKLLLLFNIILVIVIVLVYFVTQKQRNVVSQSLKNVGNFQLYIKSPKSDFLCGEALDFKVYITNMSDKKEDFSIYSFNVRISSKASAAVYTFHFDKTINASIDGKRSMLLYDLKREVNLSNLKAGTYIADILMNFNGKAVHLAKEFKYLSNVQALLVSGQDFFVTNQKGTFDLYVKNNTPKALTLRTQSVSFELLNTQSKEVLHKSFFNVPSEVFFTPAESKLLYKFKMRPIKAPGEYQLKAQVTGNKILNATSTFLVINPDKVDNMDELKLNSDIPMVVSKDEPMGFSLWLLNTSLKKKFVTVNSITIQIKKGEDELYRFSDKSSHNIIIPSGGTRLLVNSQSWKKVTLPSSGAYLFDAIVSIEGKYLEYRRTIKSF
jgi:hypothetical protein